MKVLRGLPEAPDPSTRGGVVTWGVFDGVHRGHRKVVEALVAWARSRGAPAVLLTFDRHPAEVLRGRPVPLICPLDVRIRRLGEAGADVVIAVPFTVEFSRTTAEEFLSGVIARRLGASAVLLGHDSHFGRDRAGDWSVLEMRAAALGLEVRSAAPELHHGKPMSSSLVREAVRAGRLDEAREILGRPFALFGRVVPGEGRGTRIGVPTANVAVDHDLQPPSGVYAVEVPLDGRTWKGGANLGRRPTFHPDGGAETVEVHLIGYDGPPLVGRPLEVRFLERVREERKFSGPEELVKQIRADLEWIASRR